MIKLRTAEIKDVPAITEIYNQAISNTTATFDTMPKSIEDREQWFLKHSAQYPVLIAENNNIVIGWASLSQYSNRQAYHETAEISLYINEKHQGQGIGNLLLEKIIQAGKKVKLHTILARIAAENEISIHLHEKYGFQPIGTMKEVGKKFGRRIDVCLMQYIYQ